MSERWRESTPVYLARARVRVAEPEGETLALEEGVVEDSSELGSPPTVSYSIAAEIRRPTSAVSAPPVERTPPRVFRRPFAFDDGDIILRSSDSVEFKVHSLLLRLSSTTFTALVRAPRGEIPIQLHREYFGRI